MVVNTKIETIFATLTCLEAQGRADAEDREEENEWYEACWWRSIAFIGDGAYYQQKNGRSEELDCKTPKQLQHRPMNTEHTSSKKQETEVM